jgi:2-polyprenyl-3-methyl-5-hydroxy-6-metoxy-1,4-benzoquinol methylase
VTGIDFSENSLNFARQVAEEKGLDIDYVHGNYLHFETEKRFDLIIMMMCDFCALSPEQRSILLSKFRSLLKQGGSVLLDVYTLNSFAQRQESASHELNQMNGFCIKEIFADVAGRPYHPDSAEMAITAGTT